MRYSCGLLLNGATLLFGSMIGGSEEIVAQGLLRTRWDESHPGAKHPNRRKWLKGTCRPQRFSAKSSMSERLWSFTLGTVLVGERGRPRPMRGSLKLLQASPTESFDDNCFYPSQTQSRLKSALEDNLVALSRWPGLVDPTRVLIA